MRARKFYRNAAIALSALGVSLAATSAFLNPAMGAILLAAGICTLAVAGSCLPRSLG